MGDVSTCRSCGAPIRWVKLAPKMRPHPLNAEPGPGGNIEIGVNCATVLTQVELLALHSRATLYTSHFADCPNAAQHRSKR